jgi:hypothetical protein
VQHDYGTSLLSVVIFRPAGRKITTEDQKSVLGKHMLHIGCGAARRSRPRTSTIQLVFAQGKKIKIPALGKHH